jgi:hypothetical protein
LFAVIALVALCAAACGTATETRTTTSASSNSDIEYGSWGDADSSDAPSSSDEPSFEKTLGAPASGSTDAVPSSAAVPSGPQQAAQVLAYAIEAGDELSYSFEQGMSMQMNMMGMDLKISPDAGFVTGEVSGPDSHMKVDIGVFMVSMFESMGFDASDPMFASMLGDVDSMSMDVWIVDSTMVIDMSGLASSLGALDPAAATEFSGFADGPVKFDLNAMAAFGGADAASIVQQFGQGTQITDPAALIEALRAVEAVTEVGPGTVDDDTPVTIYEANVSMADYYDALGMDVDDQLGSMEQFGVTAGTAEAEILESILPAISNLVVEMTIMLDDEGLVRRIETVMDMGAMVDAMADAADSEGADMSGLGGTEISLMTWQNFDDYGVDIAIVAPDAVDGTSELSGLLQS